MAARPVVALVGAFGGGRRFGRGLLSNGAALKYVRRAPCGRPKRCSPQPDLDVAVVDLDGDAGSGIALLKRFGREGGPFFVIVSSRPDIVEKVLALELGRRRRRRKIGQRSASLPRACRAWSPAAARQPASSSCWKTRPIDLKAALVMHRSGVEETLSPGQVALLGCSWQIPARC